MKPQNHEQASFLQFEDKIGYGGLRILAMQISEGLRKPDVKLRRVTITRLEKALRIDLLGRPSFSLQ